MAEQCNQFDLHGRAAVKPDSTLYAAICMAGRLPRLSEADVAQWDHQAAFVAKLMLGVRDYSGLHAFLVTDDSRRTINEAASRIERTWGLPPDRVHAFQEPASVDELVGQRCATQAMNLTRGFCRRTSCQQGLNASTRSFYAQWWKAHACFKQVLRVERQQKQAFKFVIKLRPDWPFMSSPALCSLEDYTRAIVYSRMRCAAPASPSEQPLLPPPYMSSTVSFRRQPFAVNANCPTNAVFVDDMFLIAPRLSAPYLFSAWELPCPAEDAAVQQQMAQQCRVESQSVPGGGPPMAECLLHVHMQLRARQLGTWPGMRFGPIKVTWDETSLLYQSW
eukprot:6097918-Prymnesium_polylepis.1